jgi:acylphosphatase
MPDEPKLRRKVGGVGSEEAVMPARKVSRRKIGGVGSAKAPTGVGAPAAPAHGDFVYNGGALITNPVVYPTFWGANWSDATHQAQAARLVQFLNDLISSDWMNVLTQYGVGSGNGGGQVLTASFIANVPATLTDAQIHQTIQTAINSATLPEPPANNASTVFVIFLDETCAVSDASLGIVMCEPNGDNAFGYHFDFTTAAGNNCYYAVIPALDDNCIKNTCPGGCSLNLLETQEQRRTQVASHEFAEMLTDPKFQSGWFGPFSDEIGDICNGQTATITVGSNTWNVQNIYSKTDDINSNGAVFCIAQSPRTIPTLAGGPVGFAVALSTAVTGGRNSDGRLEMFVVGTDDALWHTWQTVAAGGPWSGWNSLGGVLTSEAVVALNSDGRLEVFVRGTDNALWHMWQTVAAGGPWSTWESLGGVITSQPAVAVNSDGRLEVFARGTDNALYHIWQTAAHAGPWSGWSSLGGVITGDPVVALNCDGRLEVFARGTDDALWHIWQTAAHSGPWSAWDSLGGVITSDPAVGLNCDGRLEAFARGTDDALWHIWQTAANSGPWSAWDSLGGVITSDPAVGRNTDGRLEAFARGTDDALWHIWQMAANSGPWSGWDSLGGVITSDPAVELNADGRLEAFARGSDNALWHIWQTLPHAGPWSAWDSLGGILITTAV